MIGREILEVLIAEIKRIIELHEVFISNCKQIIAHAFPGVKSKIIDECVYGKEPEMVDIDDLPKEEPVSEDLEEAAKHYLYSNILYDDVYVGNPTDKDCIEMFKAGAKWQKQQMVKAAIETEVVDDSFGQQVVEVPAIRYDVQPEDNMGIGDKVKLIIIKED